MSKRGWRVLREVVLTVAAAIGTVCLVGSALMLVTGVTPVVFRSGSMAPAMPTGALALVQDRAAATVRVDDVVSVIGSDGIRITHRVVDVVKVDPGRFELTTRGDANETDDARRAALSRVDVVFWSTPQWGYIVMALQSPLVIFAGGIFAGSWVTWWLVRRGHRATMQRAQHETLYIPPPRHAQATSRIFSVVMIGTMLGGCLVGAGSIWATEPTRASFVDDSTAFAARFGVDTLGTRIARTRDGARATNGIEAAALAQTPATAWSSFPAPPLTPGAFGAEGDLTIAYDGTTFVQQYVGGAWQIRALPSEAVNAVMMTFNTVNPVVMATDGATWWYSDYPNTSGAPGPWTAFVPTGAPTTITESDFSGRRTGTTDGTRVWISESFGNAWRTVTAPGGSVRLLGYSGTTLLSWGSAGWMRSVDNGATWAADAVLNAAVPRPTDISGGTSSVGLGDNRFLIARGTSGMWRYNGVSQELTVVGPAY